MYTCQEGVAASGVAGYHRSHSDGDDTRREPPAPPQGGAGRPLPGTALDRPPCPPAERARDGRGAAPLAVAGPPPPPPRGGTACTEREGGAARARLEDPRPRPGGPRHPDPLPGAAKH